MPLTRLEIENILGIERLDIVPGTLTVVAGRNGVGKTSFLESVRFLMLGGNDSSLLRRGAEKGLVRGTFSDGKVITRTIGPKGSAVDVRIPVEGVVTKVSAPQAYLNQLIGELAMDPLALLTCPENKQAEYLTDLVSPEVSDAEIREAAGVPVPRMKANGLERIAVVRKLVYDERTAVNRTASDKATTAAQLRETLPPDGATATADLVELRANRAELAEQLTAAEKDAAAKRKTTEKAAASARETAVEAIKANAQAELDSIREDAAERIRTIERERDSALERVKERAREQAEAKATEERAACASAERQEREVLESVRAMLGGALAEQDTIIALAEAAEKEHARAEKTREILAAAEREGAEAKAKSAALTAALGRLDALRAKLLAELPIPGLEIRDGQVVFEDMPLRRLNTAAQMGVALKVAMLRAGKAGLIVVDHAEAFDPPNLAAWKAAAAEAGLQWFLGERTDGPLTVETLPAEQKAEAA